MVKMSVVYQGQKHCELTHGPSGSQIETDAPRDNQGKGERFSPTDLVCAALASCILTTMAIVAERDGVSIEGAKAEAEKHMNPQPRRIATLPVHITLPATLSPVMRQKLENAAMHCPVKKSLHGEVETPITFSYV
jgi:uncharacterized OsmC-like protein